MSFVGDPAARQLLDSLDPNTIDLAKLNQELRKAGYQTELVTWVLQQIEIRQRARSKLDDRASALLFSRNGLEQASRWPVAQYHAARFKGFRSITDLGCGIGIDSLAFSEAGLKTTSVEQDEETWRLAKTNLQGAANVILGQAETHNIDTEAVWFDPARRDLTGSHRSRKMLAASDFSPSLELVFDELSRRPGGAKLAPGFPHELIPENLEANWVSHQRELVELSLWSVEQARAGRRFATMLLETGPLEFTGEIISGQVAELGKFVFEPDPALIRSGLLGAFAEHQGLGLIAKDIAYLSGSSKLESPWLRSYPVLEQLPIDTKILRNRLAELGIGILEIKKRGIDIEPEKLRRELKLKGEGAATLILTRVGDARRALVCAAS
jgi:hypothetical protein